jgi:sugar phosphate isomerase/epimerase
VQLGLSTGFFHDHDVIPYLPVIKDAGFEVIEICLDTIEWGTPSSPMAVNNANFFLKEGLEIWQQKIHSYNLRNKLKEHGIFVHSLHLPVWPGMDLSSLDEGTRVHAVWEFKKGIEVLNYLSGEIAIVHPSLQAFDLNNQDEKYRRLQKCKESLVELIEYCKTKHVRLAVENLLPHLLGGQAHDLNQIIDEIYAENLGICFDTSHANLTQDPLGMLKSFNKRVISLHLSDNHGQFDDHLPPGDGRVPWAGIMTGLKEIGYRDIFMLEVFTDKHPGEVGQVLSDLHTQATQVLECGANNGIENIMYRL